MDEPSNKTDAKWAKIEQCEKEAFYTLLQKAFNAET